MAGESSVMYWKHDSNILCGIHTNADGASFVDVQDNYDKEYMLVAAISKAEGIKPCILDEAKCLSDWGEWEQAIREELDLLNNTST